MSSQGIQFALKNNFFNDVRSNYLPMLFDHVGNGYNIGSFSYGNKWASINLNESTLSLPDNDRDKFTNDFEVVPPKAGESTFGIKMNKINVDFESNFTS